LGTIGKDFWEIPQSILGKFSSIIDAGLFSRMAEPKT